MGIDRFFIDPKKLDIKGLDLAEVLLSLHKNKKSSENDNKNPTLKEIRKFLESKNLDINGNITIYSITPNKPLKIWIDKEGYLHYDLYDKNNSISAKEVINNLRKEKEVEKIKNHSPKIPFISNSFINLFCPKTTTFTLVQ